MVPSKRLSSWDLPKLLDAADLAEWLRLPYSQLEWFADCRGMEATTRREALRHYHYRPLTKRFGEVRLIEAPKPRLKAIQRLLLSELIQRIPPHEAAHGFRRGRSIKSFAAPHTGRLIVLRMDLSDFFPSINAARVRAIYRSVGYPQAAAELLTGLSTNSAPSPVWNQVEGLDRSLWRQASQYRWPHLPQGAPTSPTLANLCAFGLDCRLAGLTQAAGGVYTRYADDLAFSGDERFVRGVQRFAVHVAATVIEEGFTVNHRKTRIMRASVRQKLAGLVVNAHPNVSREEYDRLKATLHNCQRQGATSQNHQGVSDWRAHLTGRVSFLEMVNPQRGSKLRELLDGIDW